MMKKYAFLLLAVLLVAACGDGRKDGHKPQSDGLPYELALIVPRALYVGELKDSLEKVLQGSTPVLPQHEPMFRLNVVYAEGNLTPWRTFRNRLVVKVDEQQKQPSMGVAKDPVAAPQIEVKVEAATASELAAFIGENKELLTDLFVDSELEVEAANLRLKYSKMTADSLRRVSGHSICAPTAMRASKVEQDFLWTGSNLNDKDQNFVFYSYPWDGKPLTAEQFVQKRDSALKRNIPGSRPDQWMQTTRVARSAEGATGGQPTDSVPLIFARTRTINGINVQEVHGLWEVRNGALGGAFVSLERIDSAARRVLVTEGFIYSPHSPKRNLMRQMEAALRTFK